MSKEQIPDRDISNKQIAEAALQLKIRGLIERGETTLTLQKREVLGVSKEMLAEAIREGGFRSVIAARYSYYSLCGLPHSFDQASLQKLAEALIGSKVRHFTACVGGVTEEQCVQLKEILDSNSISFVFLSKEELAESDFRKKIRGLIERGETTLKLERSEIQNVSKEMLTEAIREGAFKTVVVTVPSDSIRRRFLAADKLLDQRNLDKLTEVLIGSDVQHFIARAIDLTKEQVIQLKETLNAHNIPFVSLSTKELEENDFRLKISRLIKEGEATLKLEKSEIANINTEVLAGVIREGGFQTLVVGEKEPSLNSSQERLQRLAETLIGSEVRYFTVYVDNFTEEQCAQLKETLNAHYIPIMLHSKEEQAENDLRQKIRGLIERGETTLTLQESDIADVSKEMLAEAIREGGFQAVVTERDFYLSRRIREARHNFRQENLQKVTEALIGSDVQHFTTCVDDFAEEQRVQLKETLDSNNIPFVFFSKEEQAENNFKHRLANFIEQKDTILTVTSSQVALIRPEILAEAIKEGKFQAISNKQSSTKGAITLCIMRDSPTLGIDFTLNILQAIENSAVTSVGLSLSLGYKWGYLERYKSYRYECSSGERVLSKAEQEVAERDIDTLMHTLKENTSLTSIALDGSISPKGLIELVELVKENNIEHLSLSGNDFSDSKDINNLLASNSALCSLHLISNTFNNFPISDLTGNTTLREFIFSKNTISRDQCNEDFSSTLTMLQHNTTLEHLCLAGCESHGGDWPSLTQTARISIDLLVLIDAKLEENRLFREREAAIVSAVTLVGRVAHLDSRVDVLSTKMNVHDEMVEEIRQTLAMQTGKLHNLQPQLFEGNMDNLATLAAASPQTIRYLETLGDSGTQAETQYNHIRSSDELYSYYNTLNRSLTSTLMASHSIFSGMVGDDRSCTSTQLLSLANSAAKSTGIPGVSLITGIIKFLGNEMESREKQQTLNRITARFPTTRHYALIEIFARELTLQQADIIGEAHKQTPKGIMEKAMGMVRWLQADDIDTPVKALATSHAASLLDTIMQTDPAIAIEPHDIPMLMAWATNDPALLEAVNTSLPVTHQPQNSHSSSVKQEEVETLRQQLKVEQAARKGQEERLNSIERALQSQKTSSQKGAVTSYNDGNGLMQLQLHAIDESTQHNGTTAEVSRADFRALTQIVSRQEAALTDTISAVLKLREDTASQGHVATIAKKSKEVTFGGRK